MSKTEIIASVIAGISLAVAAYVVSLDKETNNVAKVVYVDRNVTVLPTTYIASNTLKEYIASYKELSNRQVVKIHKAVLKASNKYKIPASILVSILAQESSFRSYIKHSTVKVSVSYSKNKISTNAVGMSGIIWEIWKDKLIEAKIAEVKSDLYDTEISINAMAFILAYNRDTYEELEDLTKLESAVQRYYGVVYKDNKLNDHYLDSINNRLGSIIKMEIYK
jgi:hypothetical protein